MTDGRDDAWACAEELADADKCDDASVRTTVTIEDDVATEIRRRMSERGVGLEVILNELLRRGLHAPDVDGDRFETPTFPLGARAGRNLDKALALADALNLEHS